MEKAQLYTIIGTLSSGIVVLTVSGIKYYVRQRGKELKEITDAIKELKDRDIKELRTLMELENKELSKAYTKQINEVKDKLDTSTEKLRKQIESAKVALARLDERLSSLES